MACRHGCFALLLCALLWGSVEAFALRYAPASLATENRLTSFGSAARFTYNGDGIRVAKSIITSNPVIGNTTNTTYYLVDDRNPTGYAQVLEEHQSTGGAATLSRVYNYGLAMVSQREAGGVTYYFVSDGHGSTRLLVGTNGAVANVFAYDAYGVMTASNATAQTVYLYTGEQWDPDLGQYHLRARYYNPQTGRFWTRDSYEGSQEDPQSLHKYLYCAASPVNRTDPSGHDPFEVTGGDLFFRFFRNYLVNFHWVCLRDGREEAFRVDF